jgi:hypothetical protein
MAATATPPVKTAKKRNPADEAELRSLMMLAMMNMTTIARFTKSVKDDKACSRVNRALYDERRWNVLAEIFFDDDE